MPILAFLAPLLGKIFDIMAPDVVKTVAGSLGIELNDKNRELVLAAEIELKKKVAELDLAMFQGELELAKGQMAINAEEAKSESLFKAGWRPAIGWICVVGVAYAWLIYPLFSGLLLKIGIPIVGLDVGNILTILMGLLGLGGLRTYEKLKLK